MVLHFRIADSGVFGGSGHALADSHGDGDGMRVLLTGGGTAGHINPALAIAEIIRQNAPGSEIQFVGIRGGKEEDLVPREGYPLNYVKSMGIRRSFSPSNFRAFWLALTSPYAKQTTRILDAFHPDLVIGTGGYACWPIMSAAVRRHIPTALHESNALPGLAVRQLQKKVDRIWINFARTAELLKVKEAVVRVGNPLRGGFGTLSKTEARRRLGIGDGQRLILSFGGSLGAEHVTTAALQMMKQLAPAYPEYLHMHASGKRDYDSARRQLAELGLSAYSGCILTDYIYDMPLWMAAADLVISRAGAMTLSELAGMRKACILIPSPYVADNHQYHNAKAMSDVGAAVLVEEDTLASGALIRAARQLLGDADRLRELEINIGAFADCDANRRIWEQIQELMAEKA